MKTRLNKFLAKAGLGTRREMEKLVKKGLVEVNGSVEKNPGREVGIEDVVKFDGKPVNFSKELHYLLLNKPPGKREAEEQFFSTRLKKELGTAAADSKFIGADNPLFCGLVLVTNDTDILGKFEDSKGGISVVFQITFAEPLSDGDIRELRKGFSLQDQFFRPVSVNRDTPESTGRVLVELFHYQSPLLIASLEKMGFPPGRMDRVYFAGLTKKGLPRGWFRHLSREETIRIKHFKNL